MSRVTYESDAKSWLDACDEVLNKYWIRFRRKGQALSKVVRIVEIEERPGGGFVITAEVADEQNPEHSPKE